RWMTSATSHAGMTFPPEWCATEHLNLSRFANLFEARPLAGLIDHEQAGSGQPHQSRNAGNQARLRSDLEIGRHPSQTRVRPHRRSTSPSFRLAQATS